MTAPSAAPVLRLPQNKVGRDFVVGDIHGCLDLVLRAMDRAKFDPAVDRVISVGDLIDRGPDSRRSARFATEPYVKALRGNHEDMLLELYEKGQPSEGMLRFACSRNGLDWWLTADAAAREEVLAAVRPLPIAMETMTPRGSVGFVHAEVPQGMDWPRFLEALEAGDERTMQTALWGRNRIHQSDDSGVAGIGRVFVGHTPVRQPLRLGNVYGVDTGAVYGVMARDFDGALTLADLTGSTMVLSNAAPLRQPDLTIVIPGEPGSRPFTRPRAENEASARAAASSLQAARPAQERFSGELACDPRPFGNGTSAGVAASLRTASGETVGFVAFGEPARQLGRLKAGRRLELTAARCGSDLRVSDVRPLDRGSRSDATIALG